MYKLFILSAISILALSACTAPRTPDNSQVEYYSERIDYLRFYSDVQICNLAYDKVRSRWRLTDFYALMELQVRNLKCDGQTFPYKFEGIEDYIAHRKHTPKPSPHQPKVHATNNSLKHVSDTDLCKQASWGQYGYNHSAPYYSEEVLSRKAFCDAELYEKISKSNLSVLCASISISPEQYPNLVDILETNNYTCKLTVKPKSDIAITSDDKLCALATNSDWRPNKNTTPSIKTWNTTGNPDAVAKAKSMGLTCGTGDFVNPNEHYNN
ncbi:hypothetical protein [Curvivirga aplysinae]|uniref:hypothetical protein n=1 Tax=Curvivirga aplysinae TaxID=2529852 RepID=UPI0012BC94E4|nr:hypothetical protein [Curvivirga aplysinae]MTI10039.1 hypothetical protein [Curvivirga aplysinae]